MVHILKPGIDEKTAGLNDITKTWNWPGKKVGRLHEWKELLKNAYRSQRLLRVLYVVYDCVDRRKQETNRRCFDPTSEDRRQDWKNSDLRTFKKFQNCRNKILWDHEGIAINKFTCFLMWMAFMVRRSDTLFKKFFKKAIVVIWKKYFRYLVSGLRRYALDVEYKLREMIADSNKETSSAKIQKKKAETVAQAKKNRSKKSLVGKTWIKVSRRELLCLRPVVFFWGTLISDCANIFGSDLAPTSRFKFN